MRRPYTDLSREKGTSSFRRSPFRARSGAFPVNNRGRWWFTWRSLQPGRRMRRPYTDLSTPPRLGCPRRRPFRSSGEGTLEKGRRGQSSFRRSPFRRGVRGIPSQPSGSIILHLEVFTSWATHASPLHGSIDATAPGMHPSAPVSFLRRGDIGEGEDGDIWRRGQSSFGEKGTVTIERRGEEEESPRRPDTDLSRKGLEM